jgi:hypothetical protein
MAPPNRVNSTNQIPNEHIGVVCFIIPNIRMDKVVTAARPFSLIFKWIIDGSEWRDLEKHLFVDPVCAIDPGPNIEACGHLFATNHCAAGLTPAGTAQGVELQGMILSVRWENNQFWSICSFNRS